MTHIHRLNVNLCWCLPSVCVDDIYRSLLGVEELINQVWAIKARVIQFESNRPGACLESPGAPDRAHTTNKLKQRERKCGNERKIPVHLITRFSWWDARYVNTRRAFQSIVAAYQLTVAKHFFHSSDCVDLIHQQSIARKAISLYWFPSIVSFCSSLSTKLYPHFLCPVWPSLPRQRRISEKRKRRSWTKSSCQIFTIDESVRQEPTEQVCKSFLFFLLGHP